MTTSPASTDIGVLPVRPALVGVIEKLQRAHQDRAWRDMRECFHDEALIESVAAGKALGPDETVAAIRSAFADGIYAMSDWTIEPLPDNPNIVIAWAGVRHRARDGTGRISDATVYWLVSGRDGLMWRVRIFGDRTTTLQQLERHGPTLGL
jgi:hypothetical protein